ncbi:MAG: ABC transporter substrate-binding protein, partial [Nitrospirae bacterium]|nr:ABC transporter substrate-binding protein [Nitrospirota bacterium]
MVVPIVLGVHGSNLMVVNPESISNVSDFRGKRVATHTKLTVHYLLTRLFFERHGLDAARDMELMIVPLDKVESFVDEKRFDAFTMPEPVNAQLEHRGKAHIYLLNKYIWKYHPCCGLSLTAEQFKKDRAKTKAVASAAARASMYINIDTNRDELINLLRKTPFGYSDMPIDVLKVALSTERSSFIPFPYYSIALFTLKMMKDFKLIPQSDNKRIAKEVFLPDFMRECLTGIGHKAPSKNYRPETILGNVHEFEA